MESKTMAIQLGDTELIMCCGVVIALRAPGVGSRIREDAWGPTVAYAGQRMAADDFDTLLEQIAEQITEQIG